MVLTFKTPMILPTGTASFMVKVSDEPPCERKHKSDCENTALSVSQSKQQSHRHKFTVTGHCGQSRGRPCTEFMLIPHWDDYCFWTCSWLWYRTLSDDQQEQENAERKRVGVTADCGVVCLSLAAVRLTVEKRWWWVVLVVGEAAAALQAWNGSWSQSYEDAGETDGRRLRVPFSFRGSMTGEWMGGAEELVFDRLWVCVCVSLTTLTPLSSLVHHRSLTPWLDMISFCSHNFGVSN